MAGYIGSKSSVTLVDGITKNGGTLEGDLSFGDNDKAKFGAGDDLQVSHDGSNSYIKDVGTGNLTISANQVVVKNAASNEAGILFTENSAVELYHDDSKKLETTSSGIIVDGNIDSQKYKLFDGSSFAGGMFVKKDVTGSGSSNDISIFADGITNGGNIHFMSGGTADVRLTVDTSGRVTTPYQPMFSAYGGAEQTGDAREVIKFTSAASNVGNHFSTSTYTFTAPVSGHYHFSFNLMTYAAENSRCQFAKNGSLIADQFYTEADGYAEYPRNSGSIIVQLSTNDTLRVDRNVQNSASERCHQNYRFFTGYLLG